MFQVQERLARKVTSMEEHNWLWCLGLEFKKTLGIHFDIQCKYIALRFGQKK